MGLKPSPRGRKPRIITFNPCLSRSDQFSNGSSFLRLKRRAIASPAHARFMARWNQNLERWDRLAVLQCGTRSRSAGCRIRTSANRRANWGGLCTRRCLPEFRSLQKSAGEVKSSFHTAVVLPGLDGVSVPPNASASIPSRTPADFSTDMASGGSRHADTINPYPTRATCFADLRDHAIRLMERRDRHGLRRCGDGQSKSNSDQPDHFVSPLRAFNLEEWINSAAKGVQSVGTDWTPKAHFARVPGGKTGTKAATSSARRGALPMCDAAALVIYHVARGNVNIGVVRHDGQDHRTTNL